jgi:hypothetical protein
MTKKAAALLVETLVQSTIATAQKHDGPDAPTMGEDEARTLVASAIRPRIRAIVAGACACEEEDVTIVVAEAKPRKKATESPESTQEAA